MRSLLQFNLLFLKEALLKQFTIMYFEMTLCLANLELGFKLLHLFDNPAIFEF